VKRPESRLAGSSESPAFEVSQPCATLGGLVLSLREPKVVSDLRQLTVALFKMIRGLPKHLRPTVAGRIEQHSLDAWLVTRSCAAATSTLSSRALSGDTSRLAAC